METGSELFNSLRPEGEGVSKLGEGISMTVFGGATKSGLKGYKTF